MTIGHPWRLTDEQREILAAYRPLLLKDQDWDFGYLVRLMIFKLERMAKCIAEAGHHRNCQRVARDIRITAERLKRSQDSHAYGPPYPLGEHRMMEFEDCPDRRGYRQLKRLPPRESALTLRWSRQHQAIEKENWDAAWEMIRKKGRCWWD